MDISKIGQSIAILATIGAGIWWFISQGWPRIIHLRAKRKTQKWLMQARKRISNLNRQNQYKLLDECNEIIKRCQMNNLQQDEDTALEIREMIRDHLRYKVRVFMFLNEDVEKCCSLEILKQNMIQSLYTFELGNTGYLDPEMVQESYSLRNCVEKWEKEISNSERINRVENDLESKEMQESPIRIIVISTPLPKNYYLWGHFPSKMQEQWGIYPPNRFWVLSTKIFEKLLPDIPIERILLRLVQRICALSTIPELSPSRESDEYFQSLIVHETTRGCLFDFTRTLSDTRSFIKLGLICPECSSKIMEKSEEPYGYRNAFLSNLSKWLLDTCEFVCQRPII